MSWRGPALDPDQQDVLSLLDDFLANRPSLSDSDPEGIAAVRREIGELGLWTLGTDEECGGGGAEPAVALIALERLGRHWPALGWASAQAHAAVEVLSAGGLHELLAGVHAATTSIVVLEERDAHVQLRRQGEVVTGQIDRVDPAGGTPTVVVIRPERGAYVIPSKGLAGTEVPRTGLAGACTRSLTISEVATQAIDCDVRPARAWLHQGGAAVAAGLAGAAAEAALNYTRQREQFGAPLTALPTVRAGLQMEMARVSQALAAVLHADRMDSSQTAGVLAHACDVAVHVAAAAVQHHGGYGYLVEYPVEGHLRDAVSLRAATASWDANHWGARALVGAET